MTMRLREDLFPSYCCKIIQKSTCVSLNHVLQYEFGRKICYIPDDKYVSFAILAPTQHKTFEF
jgi:hypothetical protein